MIYILVRTSETLDTIYLKKDTHEFKLNGTTNSHVQLKFYV